MTQTAAPITFQNVVLPASSLNPPAFFALTRRQKVLQKQISAFGGLGGTDTIAQQRAGIVSGYEIHVVGSVVITTPTGAVASTAGWPYNLLRAARFQANGQSNLINASGWALRMREVARREGFDDRGVAQFIGGASPGTARTQGTFAFTSESWGVGQNVSAIPAGTYNFDLSFYIPVAYNPKTLVGAIFAQTQSTSLELNLDWANLSDIFTVTGTSTCVISAAVTVEADMFTIPSDGKGGLYLPNLSTFHSFISQKAPNQIGQGNNEITLAGQGVGRQLMGIFWRTWNGATPAPVIPTANNVMSPYWRYGTNTTPETWQDGQTLRIENERDYNTDIAQFQGYQAIDFDKEFGFRDAVDEGSATEIRFGYSLTSNVTIAGAFCEYSQDVLLVGAAA
jgi:hypothetical protein